jgi:hypothetical protein
MVFVCLTRSYVPLIALVVASCRHHEPKSMPAPPPDGRPQPVVTSQGPKPSSRIPPDTLAGLVVDAFTGQPLSRAQVVVLYEGSALTDSSGRFRVGLPKKWATLQVRREGYFETNLATGYSPDSGQVAVFALTRDDARCRQVTTGVGFPGVVVIVRDAMSTQPPNGVVSVIVQQGERRDSVPVAAEPNRPLVVRTAAGRTGSFGVTVRAAGYRIWYGSGSTRPVPDCPWQVAPATFHAWLLPE